MVRSRCSGEQGDEFDLGFPGELSMVSSTGRPEEQGRGPGWRQRFKNHLWRPQAEVGKIPQDGQVELKSGSVTNCTWEETLKFIDIG